jgi:SAM-dependent methyltransferase
MAVLPHNRQAATTWGSGGVAYDRISETVADAIEHVLNRLDVRPGENVLDLATGTGWTARRLAQKGASVTGIDFGEEVVVAARELARAGNLDIDFRVGDVEELELPDAGFDVVVSTFGVMFASRPERAAAEIARLCRPGGRLGLVTWLPTSEIAALFRLMRPYMPPPDPAAPSPFEWGRAERVRELLGQDFGLGFETGTSVLRMPSGEAVWQVFVEGFGPTKTAYRAAGERREALHRDYVAFHDAHGAELGIAMPRGYLVTIGTRR